MSDYSCTKCSTPVPKQGLFCPRCGEAISLEFESPEPTPMAPKVSTRELIVGWTMWIAGGGMVIGGLFFLSGGRSWVAVGLGIAMFVVGMGTLIGDNSPKAKKKRTRTKKQ